MKARICAIRAYCIQADDISVLYLAMVHVGALLLAADQTLLMLSMIC